MTLPFFYIENLEKTQFTLDEATSRHTVQVLRMQAGEKLHLTDGKGILATAEITDAHKKHCGVKIIDSRFTEKPAGRRTGIAISPVKNVSRFEWFLEKSTELGITDIYPLLCQRTEREHFRHDRLNAICISAMLQSQQVWLPVLHQPIAFADLLRQAAYDTKWIAHCDDSHKTELTSALLPGMNNSLILIGPEGDFTQQEITSALETGYQPVALGSTRLRTETAGVVAATLLRLV